MDAFLKTGKYGAIHTTDKTIMGYYLIKFLSENYTQQEETAWYGQISRSGELFVKAQYIKFMQDNIKWNC